MEKDDFAASNSNSSSSIINQAIGESLASSFPSLAPTIYEDPNATVVNIEEVEEKHESDAITVLLMNLTIIGCLMLAYYVKQYRIYYLPERYALSPTVTLLLIPDTLHSYVLVVTFIILQFFGTGFWQHIQVHFFISK